MRLESDRKLAFFATDPVECLKALLPIATFHYDKNIIEKELGDDWKCVEDKVLNKEYTVEQAIILTIAELNRLDIAEKHITYTIGYGASPQVVLDPFAGAGEWLSLWKRLGEDEITTVAVEIEKNRFNSIEADYKFHSSFEASHLPEKSVNCLLFNPPYGSTSKNRNVRHYLEMIIDRDLMSADCTMILVIPEQDFLNISDILLEKFDIRMKYKVNPAEFAKWSQVVVFATYKPNKTNDAHWIQQKREELAAEVAEGLEYPSSIRSIYMNRGIDFPKLLNKMEKAAEKKDNYSQFDTIWEWAIDDNKAEANGSLTMPKPPKVGEICNILSSGLLNAFVDVPGAEHVVTGGVQNVERTTVEQIVDKKGNPATKAETLRFSRPYLNVSYSLGGKFCVKEIIAND